MSDDFENYRDFKQTWWSKPPPSDIHGGEFFTRFLILNFPQNKLWRSPQIDSFQIEHFANHLSTVDVTHFLGTIVLLKD